LFAPDVALSCLDRVAKQNLNLFQFAS
jgi:hypothetical protein